MAGTSLPTGTVTFLFTDIEGSTRLLGQLGDRYPGILAEHHDLLRSAVEAAGGVEVNTEGDSFFVVFALASQAVAGAVAAQRALASHDWPPDGVVRVRMGLHTGEGAIGPGGYVGIDVHRAARIAAAGHGGQVLVSEATRALAAPSVAEGVSFLDLGEHRLKDLPQPEHLYQLAADGLVREFQPLRTLDARRGNLPTPLTTFVGRRKVVDEIVGALHDSRLVTLTGPGGTGKTRLALRVAGEVQGTYADGVFFVPLAPITEPGLVVPTIGLALGIGEDPARSPVETLAEHLRDREILLVLDNFEQVLDAAPDVGDILAASPGVNVLATSREALHLHGEREYPIPPLELPDPAHLPPFEALSQYEAVVLFVERARAVRPDFSVTNENAPAVAEICARLDGLPLAIELAAARVKLLPPEAILKRLEHRLALLAGGARDLPARQQTLRGAIVWSYDLLDPQEQRFFARLSTFMGGATLEAIEAVCAPGLELDGLDGAASLVNKSLLRQVEGPGGEARFVMLETIREFAGERLADSADAREVHALHSGYFLGLAEQAAPELFGPKQADLLDQLAREHNNLRAALAGAMASGDVRTGLRLGAALWRFWQMRGHLVEASDRLQALVAHREAEGHPAELAGALEGAGGVAYWMGDWDAATSAYSRCLEIRRTLDDPSALAEALYNLSFVYTVPEPPRRDPERARALLDEALTLFRRVDDRRGLAKVYWARATQAQVDQRWAEARENAEAALVLFRELDDRFGAGWAEHSIGLAATALGDLAGAEEAFARGMEIFVTAGDVTGIGLLVGDHAVLEGARGDHLRAIRLRGAALAAEEVTGQALISQTGTYYPDLDKLVRGDFSEDEYQRLLADGGRMDLDEAVNYARRRPDEPQAQG
ncbi:MAG TPA: adenylate/guanylate cyclase domain-containing protein [Actinomycetota bacterium]|nr:adenylate/guanylate cyclase domain-containing protein [Actinomycetota bacterium]